MRLYITCVIIAILAAVVTTSPTPHALDEVDVLANDALANLIAYERSHGDSNKICTLQNATFRREWGSLSLMERKKYTDAMLCLMSEPPKLASKDAPGIRNRFDDFVSVHIRQTPTIHATGNFLTWHCYYTWIFEQALSKLKISANYLGCPFLHAPLHAC
ncbi:uncharacterized protein ASPGLDRAFT_34246 [Aspergillus glaucus CBS 516.65]|uniref:Tyrosinase copper-binding domain-containing protein n=1 Tax=Aspergillus glaucus CBS 516.65 TaxID=1160497 RepID=A0A1L9VNH5_ASPGL|nr:hypothetical protein ASPGLDRAFT_34246 [Aspergillus glaucus CBS 516.65]OJJ85444.1 hypothetical protein ASPGLDRAFT_34246 [Aspergillus glaucus CBS 516.65]